MRMHGHSALLRGERNLFQSTAGSCSLSRTALVVGWLGTTRTGRFRWVNRSCRSVLHAHPPEVGCLCDCEHRDFLTARRHKLPLRTVSSGPCHAFVSRMMMCSRIAKDCERAAPLIASMWLVFAKPNRSRQAFHCATLGAVHKRPLSSRIPGGNQCILVPKASICWPFPHRLGFLAIFHCQAISLERPQLSFTCEIYETLFRRR